MDKNPNIMPTLAQILLEKHSPQGFALFDAGLHPALLKWLTIGSSLDRSGELGARLPAGAA
jgi:hypothetical protein